MNKAIRGVMLAIVAVVALCGAEQDVKAVEDNHAACCVYTGLCCGWEQIEFWWDHGGDWPF